jgi:hypothetical protein
MDYTKEMRGIKQKYEVAVSKFLLKYPALCMTASKELGQMWDPNDYPPVSEIREKFAFKFEFKPITDKNDFRVNMDEHEKKRIQRDLEERSKSDANNAHRYMWDKLYNSVSHMADQLTRVPTKDPQTGKQTKVIIRDALVHNLSDLCDLLPKLNIADDKDLDAMANEVKAKLTVATPEQLRKDQQVKQTTAKEAEAILKKMDAYMGTK